MSKEVVILGMARTPIGSFQGALASVPATRLASTAMKAALERSGIRPDAVSEVILGNILTAGEGQAPARQAMIHAGIPDSVPAMTINKVCGSGMKSMILGAQAILCGDADVVVAGGMESMSQAPYLMPSARSGYRMGHQQVLDHLIHDGLWDPYGSQHMGSCAEAAARKLDITRQHQDEYATQSFRRAQEAQKAGKFKGEIVAVEVAGRKGDVALVDQDEGPGKAQFDKMAGLKPVFDKAGTITAANASTINDGAAVVVLASAEKARELGAKPLARLVSYGANAQEPLWFTTAPAEAMRRSMKRAGWDVGGIDLFEVNEAFAVVALAAQRELRIPMEKFNVWGGAISLGHPIGASGARIVITLLSALKDKGLKRGLAGICIGGGEATAVCVERLG
jgi:acetyl-CoA C-acetyltransferase